LVIGNLQLEIHPFLAALNYKLQIAKLQLSPSQFPNYQILIR